MNKDIDKRTKFHVEGFVLYMETSTPLKGQGFGNSKKSCTRTHYRRLVQIMETNRLRGDTLASLTCQSGLGRNTIQTMLAFLQKKKLIERSEGGWWVPQGRDFVDKAMDALKRLGRQRVHRKKKAHRLPKGQKRRK